MSITNKLPPADVPTGQRMRPAFGRFRPVLRICRDYFWILPALLVVLVVRAVRPLVLIRFGRLACHRIGHYMFDTELYLCERDADSSPGRTFDIFYHGREISNSQVKIMLDRVLRVWSFAGVVDRVNRLFPGAENHSVPLNCWTAYSQDMHQLVGITESHLVFNAEEKSRGRASLREIGVEENSEFVCFHARDALYLESELNIEGGPYNYRDADINRFIPGMEELGKRGLLALRMGAIVEKGLTGESPGVIDYASNHRSAFLDLFLFAQCRFFLGSHTGLFGVASTFRRPSALVNVIPLAEANTWNPRDMFITKKLWLIDEGRFMTFEEIFASGVARYNNTNQYADARIEPIENTAEEITALALEMDSRLSGEWETTQEDEELQEAFWSRFKAQHDHGTIVSRIGGEFLRNNPELLV